MDVEIQRIVTMFSLLSFPDCSIADSVIQYDPDPQHEVHHVSILNGSAVLVLILLPP